MRERHGTPFEHNSFRFHIRTPIFVAREWFRHRVGCLTGDTAVTFTNVDGQTGPSLTKTMSELYEIWAVGERNGQGLTQQEERGRVDGMRLRTLDEATNEFVEGHIWDVVDSGRQPVYRVTLADGKRLTATENHRLLTDRGWRTFREAVGLQGDGPVAVATRPCRLLVDAAQHRELAVAASMASRIGHAVGDLEVPRRKGVRLTAHPVAVVAVEYMGVEQTYDLCVEGPWHNFVANGIVVHNSFNEESARYHKLSDDFYVPAPEAVRTQVGKPGSYSFEPVDERLADETIDTFKRVYKDLFAEYEGLIEKGVAKELARAVLPFGIYTQFYWTLNARSLMNFLSLRNATAAQHEIRVYADAVERLFAEKMPITHECFVEFGRRCP
ncbi:MAG: FAD-dependent thymidylate synthase [Actinomycetota bacterium]|nr:FAD-dependent thymidylate synthase [Actinomycetota bacterium]